MSSITFDATLDISKIESAIKQSNQTVSDWAKNVEKAGSQADDSFGKVGESVKKQVELIKSLNDEMKSVFDSMKSTKDIGGLQELDKKLDDLRTKRDEATAALEKMNNQQEEAVVQDEKEVTSKGSIISALGKWASGLFSVAAVLKIVKDIIASTEGTANKFAETVGLLKGGFEGLYRTIATGQWDQLINNIVNSAKATRDLKAATNELTHIVAGGTIERADLLAGLEKARANAATSTDNAERKKYLDQAIDFQKQITVLNVGEIKERLAIDEDYYSKLTGHSKEYYDYLLTQIPIIAKNYEAFYAQQGLNQERLNDLNSKSNMLSTFARDADGKAIKTKEGLSEAEQNERHQLTLFLDTLADYKTLQDDLSKKGQWDEYIKGIGEMRTAAAQGDQALVYLNRQSETAGKGIGDLNKQIADQEALLMKAVAGGDATQIKAIAERIKVLQDELDIRTKIAQAAILTAMTEGHGNVTKIDTSNIKVNVPFVAPTLPGLQDASTQASLDADLGKAKQWNIDDAAHDKQKKLDWKEIVRDATEMTMELAKQVGMSDEEAKAIGATVDALGKISEASSDSIDKATQVKDIVGAAITAISMIISMLPNEAAKFADQMAVINEAVKEAQRLVDLSERTGGGGAARQTAVDAAKATQTADELELQKAIDKKNDKVFAFGPVYEADKKKVIDLTVAVAEDQAAIDKAQQALDDFLTATNEMNIADSIEQGFEAGKTSAADFADTFNGFMTGAINNALEDALKPEVEAWYKQLAIDMKSGGGLDDKEIAAEKLWWDKIIAEGEADRQAAYKAAGISPTIGTAAQAGLSGQIAAQMTEDTGSELAGLFRRYADDERLVRDYSKLGVNHLVSIEANTYNTVLELQRLNDKTDTVISITRSTYVAPFPH
jgi:hypothetical protein